MLEYSNFESGLSIRGLQYTAKTNTTYNMEKLDLIYGNFPNKTKYGRIVFAAPDLFCVNLRSPMAFGISKRKQYSTIFSCFLESKRRKFERCWKKTYSCFCILVAWKVGINFDHDSKNITVVYYFFCEDFWVFWFWINTVVFVRVCVEFW